MDLLYTVALWFVSGLMFANGISAVLLIIGWFRPKPKISQDAFNNELMRLWEERNSLYAMQNRILGNIAMDLEVIAESFAESDDPDANEPEDEPA